MRAVLIPLLTVSVLLAPSAATAQECDFSSRNARKDTTAKSTSLPRSAPKVKSNQAPVARTQDCPDPPVYSISVAPQGTDTLHPTQPGYYSAVFTVTNTGNAWNGVFLDCGGTNNITCTGIDPNWGPVPIGPGEWINVSVDYTANSPGTGTVTLSAVGQAGGADNGEFVVVVSGSVPSPTVTPDGEARLVRPLSGARLAFTIRNPGIMTRSYALGVTCNGIVTSCTPPSPATVQLDPAASTIVWATLTTAGAGLATGTMTLTATDQAAPTALDGGSYNLTMAPLGPVVARDQCLTIGAGAGAAYECGDLRLVHALPALRTLNKPRAPVLLYSSQHAHPYQLLNADVTLPGASPLPTTVRAVLWINGTRRDSTDWAGTAWGSAGQTRRIVMKWEPPADSTKPYDYRIELKRISGGVVDSLPSVLGQVIVVSRRNSPFGPGWWLAGYEQIVSVPGLPAGQALWVGGDGSAALYQRGSAIGSDTAYLAPLVDRPDTLLHTAGNEWKRLLSGGDTVVFSSSGVHIRTSNRLGYRTLFTDSSGLLVRIEVPGDTSLRYRFTYSGSPTRLTQVTIPDSAAGTYRVTSLAWAGDSVRITDPGTTAPVTFRYQAGGTNRMQSRTNRRGGVTRFVYNAASRLDSAKFDLGGGDSINASFCAAEARGIIACSPNLLAPESVYTRFDGPRRPTVDSLDVMDFWVDRFGAPTKIRDPYGALTTVTRGDVAGPALVTRVQYPNGRITGATYDARGNIASSTDSSLYVTGQHATTRYQWDQRWDNVTETVAPTGEVMHFAYDATKGNRLWQEDGRGVSSRVNFAYYTNGNGAGLVKTVTDPLGAKDSVAYDARGNMIYSRTPLEYVTTSVVDRLGRARVVLAPVSAVTRRDSTSYDQRGLPLRTVAFGPAVNGAVDQKIVVRNFYNVDGQLDSLQRWAEPDSADIDTVTTRWRYDLAGRTVAEISSDLQRDSTRYDPAGNGIATVTRRGDTLTMSYDRLNRLRRRVVPPVTYLSRCQGIAMEPTSWGPPHPYPWFPTYTDGSICSTEHDPASATLTLAPDTSLFSYGPMGELLTANNQDARIKRSYYKDGRVSADTLKIRTWDGTDTLQHVYGIAYQYDLSGRLTLLRHPQQLAPRSPGVMDTAHYEYDPLTGALAAVVDPLGNRFALTYSLRGERTRIDRPGGIVERFFYDLDGRLVADTSLRGTAGFRRATFEYADGERVSVARNSEAPADTVHSYYSGLGHLVNLTYEFPVVNSVPPFDTAHVVSSSHLRLDALGNTLYAKDSSTLSTRGGSAQVTDRHHVYGRGTGRLVMTQTMNVDSTVYDHAGNLEFSYQWIWPQDAALDNRANYYGADNRLRVAEHRTLTLTGNAETSPWTLVYEVYRYDALGRRVAARTWRNCNPVGGIHPCNMGTLTRTVWDGDRELYEIRQWSSQGDYDAGWLENDTTPKWSTKPYWDASPQFGRVAYTHGPDLDQPLSAIRLAFVDTVPNYDIRINWPPIAVVPQWNWRAQADVGALASGLVETCQTTSHGQRCVGPVWLIRPYPFAQQRSDTTRGWWGNLLRDKEDGTGMFFRRNRYVDPTTGRFTQEDPIGLAGGLNLYGFAAGDPVNFGDPFGLAADTLQEVTVQQASTEEPVQAQRTMCLDQNVAGAAQGLANDAANLIGVTPVFNNAYRDRITAATPGRRSGGAGSLHLSGFAFDISTRGLTAGQLGSFTALASAYGFQAVAGDPGHYQWAGGDAAAYGSHGAAVREASRSYAAGECTDANVEAVRRGNR